ncbi:MAG: hypothetical protein JW889_16185 [Verrucomicrobia bacterium]|nr:hypothetical protein [Verrucomicrobiota bacterium]
MKRVGWQAWFAIALVALSAVLYVVHYGVFRDAHHIFIYLLGDIAFVPLEVLFVTLIVHRLLTNHEKRSLLHKLNMVIGTFFREMGTELLAQLVARDTECERLSDALRVQAEWTNDAFIDAARRLTRHKPEIDARRGDLGTLADFLSRQRDFLLALLQNPNLLEHEAFSDLLWAVFHLADELGHRRDLKSLGDADCRHLAGDMARVHRLLVAQWVGYMKHLKDDYPFLFSLALRTNPFDPEARVEVA